MSIEGVKPFNAQVFQKKDLGSIITGAKPLWVKYQGSDGKVKETPIKPEQIPYYTAFNSHSTEEKPNLSPKDVFNIKDEINKQTKGTKVVPKTNLSSTGTDYVLSKDSIERQDFFGLLDLYQDENSESGKEITPKEQAEIIETYSSWYKDA